MRKLKYLVCLGALLILSLPSFAQNRERNNGRNGRDSLTREELMSKRNTYLSEKMVLTAAEAAVFFPLENELLRKKFEISGDCRRLEREMRSNNKRTDDDFKKLLKCREEEKDKRDKLDKEYLEKFKKIMPAEKILKYQNAEKSFFDDFVRDRR